jgi:hypothetical protein
MGMGIGFALAIWKNSMKKQRDKDEIDLTPAAPAL